jgi:Oxidoreductase family, NAD-binding Rossmann fold/Oxidoreductase family, C-terminal alpha/beta domain
MLMSSPTHRVTRRAALKQWAAASFAFPAVMRAHASAAPSETVYHASFGASGMAGADIGSLTASPYIKLVAVADVDLRNLGQIKKRFPDVKVYQDWRELLDKEKKLNSVNVSTPDHMHAPIAMRAMQQGLHVYGQKPLAQTIYEARQLTRTAREKKLVTQMGIQIHSHEVHRTIVATIQAGTIGKVREVHSWSGKHWGDRRPTPTRVDKVPADLNWNFWLGVASERPFLAHYYHPGEWRKRLDFGTGTFGDMGCHILDPVYGSLALTAPTSIRSDGGAPNGDNWGLDSKVRYVFPQTKHTTEALTLFWYDGKQRPPGEIKSLIGKQQLSDQGSIFIGDQGVLYAPYIDAPVLLPADKFKDVKLPNPGGNDHYLQFVEACRGNGKTSAPFDYSGPLTESVLLGCLATRFPGMTLEWDPAELKVTNVSEANAFVRRVYRKGWGVEGL